MFSIENIRELLIDEKFILSQHAFKRTVERIITIEEISETAKNAKIIEEYPDDKYSPSCLILGFTNNSRPLHIQIATESSGLLKIITIYEPDLLNWEYEYKRRRK